MTSQAKAGDSFTQLQFTLQYFDLRDLCEIDEAEVEIRYRSELRRHKQGTGIKAREGGLVSPGAAGQLT
jgi:hypothetical protein